MIGLPTYGFGEDVFLIRIFNILFSFVAIVTSIFVKKQTLKGNFKKRTKQRLFLQSLFKIGDAVSETEAFEKKKS